MRRRAEKAPIAYGMAEYYPSVLSLGLAPGSFNRGSAFRSSPERSPLASRNAPALAIIAALSVQSTGEG